jgi:hypothetical protein
MKPILLKLDDHLHALYAAQAKSQGVSLSEWIRAKCNANLKVPAQIESRGARNDSPHAIRLSSVDSSRRRLPDKPGLVRGS